MSGNHKCGSVWGTREGSRGSMRGETRKNTLTQAQTPGAHHVLKTPSKTPVSVTSTWVAKEVVQSQVPIWSCP